MSNDRTTEMLNYLTEIIREFGVLRGEMNQRFEQLEANMNRRFEQPETEMNKGFDEMNTRIDRLEMVTMQTRADFMQHKLDLRALTERVAALEQKPA